MRLALMLSVVLLLSLAACQPDRRPIELGIFMLCAPDEERPLLMCRGAAVEIREEAR